MFDRLAIAIFNTCAAYKSTGNSDADALKMAAKAYDVTEDEAREGILRATQLLGR